MTRPIVPLALLAVSVLACEPAAPAVGPSAPPSAPPVASTTAPAPPPTAPDPAPPVVSGYDKPPPNILDVMHAPSPPAVYLAPTRDRLLLVSWQDYPSIARVAAPFLRLAGVRVEPQNHSRHDTPGGYGITPCVTDLALVRVENGSQVKVALPEGGCPGRPSWSADGKRFAFQNVARGSVELWVGDGASGEAHKVPGVRLNPMLGSSMQWLSDQTSLLVKLVPEGVGAPPPAPEVPHGPAIQETDGRKGESSTYETRDTLQNKHDEDLFDYYASAQLAVVDVSSGALAPVGKPAALDEVAAAPDGRHILVEVIHKPYSYVTTADRFPRDIAVWDRAGTTVKLLASVPLADRVPVHGVRTGPRHFAWRQTEPATLTWAEALDGGDWKVKVPARDKVMMQRAPFADAPVEIARTEMRYEGLSWLEKPGAALLGEYDDNRHWYRVSLVQPDDAKAKPQPLWDLSSDERYKKPGEPVWRQLPNGAWVVQQDGDAIYLSGTGASPEGDRPFLDRFDLKARRFERLFRCDRSSLERFLGFTPGGTRSFFTLRQSPTDPPNVFVRALGATVPGAPAGEPVFASTPTALTHIPDPTPAVRAIKKRLVKYKRKDGVDLSFTLYTPPGYQEGTRIPAVLYAYPLDYAEASKASQVSGSENTFTRLRGYRLLLLAGYAVIDNASFPIVGDPKKAYDTYLEQLLADAQAAVDKAVELGVVDPDRIGVTGHSHGAMMTANLIAHSDLFRAGAAESGAYNKILTPFGFQNERRSVWEAQNVYLKVSPYFSADKMRAPLLLIHGDDDANPGTTPLQSAKLFEAIRGNGGVARLVMLPHEPHSYTAMESNEQVVYETLRWFDKYVKDAPPRAGTKAPKGN